MQEKKKGIYDFSFKCKTQANVFKSQSTVFCIVWLKESAICPDVILHLWLSLTQAQGKKGKTGRTFKFTEVKEGKGNKPMNPCFWTLWKLG